MVVGVGNLCKLHRDAEISDDQYMAPSLRLAQLATATKLSDRNKKYRAGVKADTKRKAENVKYEHAKNATRVKTGYWRTDERKTAVNQYHDRTRDAFNEAKAIADNAQLAILAEQLGVPENQLRTERTLLKEEVATIVDEILSTPVCEFALDDPVHNKLLHSELKMPTGHLLKDPLCTSYIGINEFEAMAQMPMTCTAPPGEEIVTVDEVSRLAPGLDGSATRCWVAGAVDRRYSSASRRIEKRSFTSLLP
jgi:hypothetical protein